MHGPLERLSKVPDCIVHPAGINNPRAVVFNIRMRVVDDHFPVERGVQSGSGGWGRGGACLCGHLKCEYRRLLAMKSARANTGQDVQEK